MTQEMTVADLKRELRLGPYCWPGGYPTFFITSDGAALSHRGVRENYRSVIQGMRHGFNDGWRVVAIGINWEDPSLYCEATGERIESAYAEPDED